MSHNFLPFFPIYINFEMFFFNQKEYMKMMGLDNWMHWLAWFTKCFVFLIASVVLMTIFLKVITPLKTQRILYQIL